MKIEYKQLVKELVAHTVISIVILDDPTKFRRKLSMAKHRLGVDGSLDFTVEVLDAEWTKANHGLDQEAYSVCVVLRPPKDLAVSVLTVGSGI